MSDMQQGPGWWLASDGKWYPPAAGAQPPVYEPAPMAAAAVPSAAWPTLGGAAALFFGAFLPWATVTAPFIGQVSKNGTDGDGVLTLPIGIAIAVLAFPLVSKRELSRRRGLVILILAIVATAISGYDLIDVSNAAGDAPEDVPADITAGVGLYLTLVGALAASIGGAMALRTSD